LLDELLRLLLGHGIERSDLVKLECLELVRFAQSTQDDGGNERTKPKHGAVVSGCPSEERRGRLEN
jgi:hypothetical protein